MKILAIVGDPDTLTSLTSMVARALPGCVVVAAAHWPDGVALARAEDPDVILIDGVAGCQELKGDDDLRAIPLVFLTMPSTDAEHRRRALAAGVDGFLSMPVDQHELVALARAMARLKQANWHERELEAMHRSEHDLRAAERTAHIGHWTWETASDTVIWSDEMKRIWGLDPVDFAGDLSEIIQRALHPDDRARVLAANQAVLVEQHPIPLEYRIIRPDASERTVRAIPGEMIKDVDGKVLRLAGIVEDITDWKRAEASLHHITQLYDALGHCSQAILRCSSEAELFPQICRDLVTVGGMKMAWIGMVDPTSERVLTTVSFGDDTGFLTDIGLTVGAPIGQGPSGLAFRTDAPAWREDYLADPRTAPWHAPAARAGFAASASLPLHRNGVTTGVVTLYSSMAGSFSEAEKKLLLVTAAEIDFALDGYAREAARQDSEAFNRALVNAIPDLIFSNRRDGEFLAVHAADPALLYAPPETFLHRPIRDVLPPHVAELFLNAFAEALRSGTLQEVNYALAMDTETRHFEARVMPSTGDSTITIVRDVTVRKRAEAELRTLSRALEQSPTSIVITDRDGNIEYVNPRFEQVTGYARAEVVGRNPRLLKSGHTPPATYDQLWAAIVKGDEWRGELCNRRKSGELFWEYAAVSGLRDEDGRVAHYIAVKEDITARKQAEQQLRHSEARLADAQEVAKLGSWETDLSDLSVIWSDETYRIFGLAAGSFQASHPAFIAFVHPEDRVRVDADFSASLNGGESHTIEHRIVTADDRVKHVEERWRIVQDEYGRPSRAVGTCQDITARREAEEARAELQEQLKQSQKMESIGLLAGGVAHDFNNQLAVILSYAELSIVKLGKGLTVDPELEGIRKAAQHSADLTRQLLAFARKQTLAPEVLDLNDAIDGVLRMLRRLLGEHVSLVWTPASQLWKIAADPTQVDQVLANLAVNARNAMSEGVAMLEVSTANVVLDAAFVAAHPGASVGDFVRLRVRDTGSGMDAHTLSRIFEPFFTTKERGEGTGLGLSTVRGIVEQHGGFVDVESTPGVGTTFHVFFPRTEALFAEDAPPEPPLLRGTETILLAEDEEGVRTSSAELLRMMGYTVLLARDGREAVALADGHPAAIDLLLTDVIMPGLNGAQLRDQLHRRFPDLKVLFMSGYSDHIVSTEGVLAWGTHFIQKPFTMRTLSSAVRQALDD